MYCSSSSFCHLICILCLIVEFCAHFLHLFAPFRAWILTPADIFMSWIFCASECTFCLFGSHQRTPHFGLSFGPIADFRLVCHPILGHFCSWHDFEWIFQGTHQVEQPGLCRCFAKLPLAEHDHPFSRRGSAEHHFSGHFLGMLAHVVSDPRDNRLVGPRSSHLRTGSAPRCRLGAPDLGHRLGRGWLFAKQSST